MLNTLKDDGLWLYPNLRIDHVGDVDQVRGCIHNERHPGHLAVAVLGTKALCAGRPILPPRTDSLWRGSPRADQPAICASLRVLNAREILSIALRFVFWDEETTLLGNGRKVRTVRPLN